MSYSLIVGDLEPDMELSLTINGEAESLVGASSIEMRWKKPDGTVSLVDLTDVALVDGVVKRVWEVGDTSQAGTHRGRVVVTRSNGETQTFPNDGSWFIWTIHSAT